MPFGFFVEKKKMSTAYDLNEPTREEKLPTEKADTIVGNGEENIAEPTTVTVTSPPNLDSLQESSPPTTKK